MGKVTTGLVSGLLLTLIVMIVVFTVLADTGPDVARAATNVTDGNVSLTTDVSDVYPLTSFMGIGGIILLALMAGVVLVVLKGVLKNK